ncbi:pyridine nucleotide-disulfide oxidoreductase [Actinomadura sp. CNU-125]|uniref:NAD(P)/FAD-dependent oxidoreductase n=1 Tax=Actinomadura sp. CNU-125 TaxID=1904961 RepID=UPI000963B875|nr:FAD-dependent oxidoreductase [Actinomadura sp. CNU-125]OLT23223.1 pyridine nucleotide-disulfide oxidoreductase [Actinomadura sp. CNU-125]
MSTTRTRLTPAVAIVGGGPAGLRTAAELARSVPGPTLVLEREQEAGGIPRHCGHTGFGLRDLHRVLTGPAYARRMVRGAERAGAEIRTGAMVTGWSPDGGLEVTAPDGLFEVHADAVVLATGARERPRTARLVPGDRPDGVYTTGHLQNLVHLHHRRPGRRAVVVGSELVSWSAVLTLREAGCRTVLMTTERPRGEAYALLPLAGRAGLRVPLRTRTRVTRIIGKGRVEAVQIEDAVSGRRWNVPCDTVVFTGDWIPDNELARSAGLELSPGTLGPAVDGALRTSRPGVFAAGNMLHPVDTADIAALDGAHAARTVLDHLAGRTVPGDGVRIVAAAPLRWISPAAYRPGDRGPARGRLLAWTDEYAPFPRVTVAQNGRTLAERRLPWPAAPGRVFRIPGGMLDAVRPGDGDVHVSLRG